jgi:hypothetical protein
VQLAAIGFVGQLKTIRAALEIIPPEQQREFLQRLRDERGMRVFRLREKRPMEIAPDIPALRVAEKRLREEFGSEWDRNGLTWFSSCCSSPSLSGNIAEGLDLSKTAPLGCLLIGNIEHRQSLPALRGIVPLAASAGLRGGVAPGAAGGGPWAGGTATFWGDGKCLDGPLFSYVLLPPW